MPQPTNPATSSTIAAALADDPLWSALAEATVATHELFGELGRSGSDVVAYLARDRASGELVALCVTSAGEVDGAHQFEVAAHAELGDAVPGPREPCHACDVPIHGWQRRCAVCGSDEGVVVEGSLPGTTRDDLLQAVSAATHGQYELLGDMRRGVGGGRVYFGRELAAGGRLTALRLMHDGSGQPGATSSFGLAAVPLVPAGPSAGPTATAAAAAAATPLTGAAPAPPVGFTLLFGAAPSAGADAPSTEPPTTGTPGAAGTSAAGTGAAGTGAAAKVCPVCGATYAAEVKFCATDGAGLRPIAATNDVVGQIIADRFHILSKLGEGGMGEVYLAEHVQLGRRCAVKVMRQGLHGDAEAAARFHREAKNASEIAHPNVATIFDFGETHDGVTYLVMEYVDGEPLSATVGREGPQAPVIVAWIGRLVAEALGAAHELGIVHRDLKPDNVMLAVGRDGRQTVKVVDFGIAKAMEGLTQQVTRTGFRIGTPAYMSPEQIRGEPLDGRSDLYSLGCILFELATGQRAFDGEVGDVMTRRLTGAPPRPRDVDPDIPRALDDIIVRLLARSPDDRFASAAELAATFAVTPLEGTDVGWKLPFVGRKGARTAATTPGIQISGIERRQPGGPVRTPPPVPQSPSVARPITPPPAPVTGPTAGAPAARPGVARTPFVVGLLVASAVVAALLLRDDFAGDGSAGASADASPVAAAPPGGPTPDVAPVTDTVAAAAPPVAGPAAEPAGPAPATPVAVTPTPGPAAPPPRQGGAEPRPRPPAVVSPAVSTPAVTPPPVVAAPVPAGPTAEERAAEEERAEIGRVQQMLTQYMQALDGRDAATLRRLHPGADTRSVEERSLTDWSARLVAAPTVTVAGTTGQAEFRYVLSFFHPSMGTSRSTVTARAGLQRTGDGWRIVRLDASSAR